MRAPRTLQWLLTASLLANLVLLFALISRIGPHRQGQVAPVRGTAVAPDAAAADLRSVVRRFEAAGDANALREGLLAAGLGESAVRGMVEGLLQRRFREAILPHRLDRIQRTWWRSTALAIPGLVGPDPEETRRLREMVLNPLERAFGPDPLTAAETLARYDFLTPEKAALLAAIDRDYDEMRLKLMQARPADQRLKTELDELRLLAAERRKDVLAALAPAERAEYDLRFGMEGYDVRVRLEPM